MGYFFSWLLTGYFGYLFFVWEDDGAITVNNLFIGLLASTLGLLIPIILIFAFYGDKVVLKRKYK